MLSLALETSLGICLQHDTPGRAGRPPAMSGIAGAVLIACLAALTSFAPQLCRAALSFDASQDSVLPDSAVVNRTGDGADIRVDNGKLILTPGTTAGSAFACLSFSSRGSGAGQTHEITLDVHDFTGSYFETSGSVLWFGWLSTQSANRDYMLLAGKWIGVVLEMRQNKDGLYVLGLRQRWEMTDLDSNLIAVDEADKTLYSALCTLDRWPNKISLRVEKDNAIITIEGANFAFIADVAQRNSQSGEQSIHAALDPRTTELLDSSTEGPAIGITNFGTVDEVASVVLNGFSVSP